MWLTWAICTCTRHLHCIFLEEQIWGYISLGFNPICHGEIYIMFMLIHCTVLFIMSIKFYSISISTYSDRHVVTSRSRDSMSFPTSYWPTMPQAFGWIAHYQPRIYLTLSSHQIVSSHVWMHATWKHISNAGVWDCFCCLHFGLFHKNFQRHSWKIDQKREKNWDISIWTMGKWTDAINFNPES